MKKFLMTILILAMVVCGAIGIAACDKDKPNEDQNQGQVEDKDKNTQDKEEDKKEPNAGTEQKPGSGTETTPGGDKEENKDDNNGDKEENTPPKNPEEEKPGEQTPSKPEPDDPSKGDEDKEEDKKDEEDKGEEQEPQGPSDPDPDLPDEPEKDEPEKDEPEKDEPEKDEPKPDDPVEGDHEHKWAFTPTGTDPSNAKHVMTCTVKGCGERVTENCTFQAPTQVEPTCTEDGYKGYTCQVCGQLIKVLYYDAGRQIKRATGHNYSDWTRVDGSELHTRHCTNKGCKDVQTESCVFEGEVKEPTCDAEGVDNRTCKLCHAQPKVLGATQRLEHIWEYQPAKDGNSHIKSCTRDCCKNKSFGTEPCEFKVLSTTDGDCTTKPSTTSQCEKCERMKVEESSGGYGHKYTTTNFCDVCHQDGLKVEFGKLQKGNWGANKVVYTEELKEVSIIIIGEMYNDISTTGIDNGAFNGFSKLEKVYIPKSMANIGLDAFDNSGIKSIYYGGTESNWRNMYADGQMRNYLKDQLQLPNGAQITYEKTEEQAREEWNVPSVTATFVALPAGDKRIYE